MGKRGLISDERVQAYAAVLGKAYLGLQADVYLQLLSSVTMIIHVSHQYMVTRCFATAAADGQAAWPVHFASSLSSFEESIQGEYSPSAVRCDTNQQGLATS